MRERIAFNSDAPLQAHAQALLRQYPSLAERQTAMSAQRFLENLAYLEWLDEARKAQPDWFPVVSADSDSLKWLDVGAKNWAYIDALCAFAGQLSSEPLIIEGIELDPHRRYADFTTRQQAARAASKPYPNAQYHGGNVLDWQGQADLITHFLPFVYKDPHLAWGLPLKHFQPERVLRHLLNALTPGGVMLIVNQGEAEAEAQQALLDDVALNEPILVKALGQLPAHFIEYRYPRFGWLIKRA